ncbi:hypothetical protein ACQ4PT_032037 [Festuca glaucescens]
MAAVLSGLTESGGGDGKGGGAERENQARVWGGDAALKRGEGELVEPMDGEVQSEKLTGAGLEPLVKRLRELRKGGLTGEMVGKEFIRRRIAPLQDHKKDMWFYSGEEDPMQLQEGALDDAVVDEMTKMLFADATVPDLLDAKGERENPLFPALEAGHAEEAVEDTSAEEEEEKSGQEEPEDASLGEESERSRQERRTQVISSDEEEAVEDFVIVPSQHASAGGKEGDGEGQGESRVEEDSLAEAATGGNSSSCPDGTSSLIGVKRVAAEDGPKMNKRKVHGARGATSPAKATTSAESARLRGEEARREVKEIHDDARDEAEEILAEARGRIEPVEECEEALAVRDRDLAAREGALAAREESIVAPEDEERFVEKQKTLEDAKQKLVKELKGVRASLDKVTQAKDVAASEASKLMDELASLQAQVGPITEAVEKNRHEALAALMLKREWCKMFRTLAVLASSAVKLLGVRDFRVPAIDDDTAFLQLFTQIVEKLEGAAVSLDKLIEEECRKLLSIAGTRIFANLLHANLSLDFATVLRRVDPSLAFKLAKGVKDHVEALLKLYQWKKDGESAGTSSEASDDALGGDLNDSGSSA